MGADVLTGGSGSETLDGGRGDDVMTGGAGDDQTLDDGGSSLVRGGPRDDVLTEFSPASAGSNRVYGGPGRDVLTTGDARGRTRVIRRRASIRRDELEQNSGDLLGHRPNLG